MDDDFELANVKTNIVCVCVCARASGWVAKEGVCKHFKRGTGGNEGRARCNKCFKIFEKSVTTILRYHAESKHNFVVEKMTVGGKKEPDKNQPTIESFKDKKILQV